MRTVFLTFFVLVYIKWLMMNIVQTTISIKNWYEKKETVKFIHDQLKIKKMRKHAVKK